VDKKMGCYYTWVCDRSLDARMVKIVVKKQEVISAALDTRPAATLEDMRTGFQYWE
jgi:hypothetical protein